MKRSRTVDHASVVPAVVPVLAGSNWTALSKKLRRSASDAKVEVSSTVALRGHGSTLPALKSDIISAAKSEALLAARATVLGPFGMNAPTGEHARVLALDCEMVGVGPDGRRSALAQVVIVDWNGRILLNRYVRPAETVTDFRTHVSGVTSAHLRNAESLASVQRDVSALLHGRILVGHGLENDMTALLLSHPSAATRDTAKFQPFCWRAGPVGKWRASKLKNLADKHLQLSIQVQDAAHEPAEDARAALALYKFYRREWEHGLIAKKVGKKVGGLLTKKNL